MAEETKITDPATPEAAAAEAEVKKKAAAEKAAEAKRKKAEAEAKKKAATPKPAGNKALALEYAKRYPKEKEFHITTDKQVFLSRDLSLARAHQRSLGGDGQVETIKIN